MGNSPSAATSSPASAPAPVPAPVSAPMVNTESISSNKKNNIKTVVQVPAENVTISKGGVRRRFRGGMASVHFDSVNRQPSDAVMERVTSGGRRRSHRMKRKSHKARKSRRHAK